MSVRKFRFSVYVIKRLKKQLIIIIRERERERGDGEREETERERGMRERVVETDKGGGGPQRD